MTSRKSPIAVVAALFLIVAGAAAAGDEVVRWKMTSTFNSTTVQIGTVATRFVDRLEALSQGGFQIRFFEPGALVPALEIFDAVSMGALQAGWSTPAYWAGKVPALQLFAAVPFGPRASEYLAWFYFGGGKELYDEIYHRHGIHGVICAVITPEASGWFRREIKTVEDLKGLRMRFFGLGALVMEKLGVSTQLLAGGDIFPALELGAIDATEFSTPAVDEQLGFHQVAKHYYFPGWHQPSSLADLMINLDEWNGLSDLQRLQIEITCGDSVRHSIAEGEAIQFAALEKLRKHGVTLHTWSPAILERLRAAWGEVVREQSRADPDFARVWASLSAFRRDYAVWEKLGYLH